LYKVQELKEGDIVDLQKNLPEWRFGIVIGGFGMSTDTLGSKIYGVFGSSVEEVKENYKLYLQHKQQVDAKWKLEGEIDPFDTLVCEGYTRRGPCKIVGHLNLETGADETAEKTD